MKTSIERWQEVDGDNTLALDWPLNEYSLVWEIGGFEGRWAQQIYDKYKSFVHVFEPQLWAAQKLRNRFSGTGVWVEPYGLWIDDDILPMGNYHTDGASLVKHDGREEKQLGTFRYIRDELKECGVDGMESLMVDLALMNIEGGEYILLPFMIENGLMENFKNFWCQFHPEGPEDLRHEEIFSGMEKTHEVMWDFYPTAVAWRRK